MSLIDQINQDLLQATKSGDVMVRDTLRIVKTAIKNSEINKGHTLSDEEAIEVIAKEVKQRVEAVESFTSGNRPELAAKEEAEMAVLKRYLPEQLSEEQVRALVEEAIATSGATSPADMGKVMGALMPKTKGKADGSLVSRLVREKLGS